MSNNIVFNLKALIEAIDQVKEYSKEFTNSDDFYHDQKLKILEI